MNRDVAPSVTVTLSETRSTPTLKEGAGVCFVDGSWPAAGCCAVGEDHARSVAAAVTASRPRSLKSVIYRSRADGTGVPRTVSPDFADATEIFWGCNRLCGRA